jgi:hypothetical protein
LPGKRFRRRNVYRCRLRPADKILLARGLAVDHVLTEVYSMDSPGRPTAKTTAGAALRSALFWIVVLGMGGTGAELLLLGHTEDRLQWIPLALIFFGLLAAAWHRASRSAASLRAFQAILLGFVASGVAGIYFHYRGSAEFKLESNPSLGGWDLFRQAIRSKAPPLLAPGAMIQIGLIGLVFTYRHPALARSGEGEMK